MATIDVLLPVKNGIDYLSESLDSICNQTFKDWRLLVLDHGSTDGSRELAEEYHRRDPRVEVHSFPDAVGLAGLLNKGLEIADCQYVMRHDADDIAYPDRMEVTLEAFRRHPDVAVISGRATMIDGDGNETGTLTMPIGHDRVTAASFFRNPILHPGAMISFEYVRKLGIRYGVDFLSVLPKDQQITVNALAEDYFMFGQLAIMGLCLNIPNKLIKYRWHGGNVSVLKFRDQMDISIVISRYLARVFCLVNKVPYFDPAPFCNHGGILFDVDHKSDFSRQLSQISKTLESVLGKSPELSRELAYRKVISTRRTLLLAWRYLHFKRKNAQETGEWYAVKAWLIRLLPSRQAIFVNGEG